MANIEHAEYLENVLAKDVPRSNEAFVKLLHQQKKKFWKQNMQWSAIKKPIEVKLHNMMTIFLRRTLALEIWTEEQNQMNFYLIKGILHVCIMAFMNTWPPNPVPKRVTWILWQCPNFDFRASTSSPNKYGTLVRTKFEPPSVNGKSWPPKFSLQSVSIAVAQQKKLAALVTPTVSTAQNNVENYFVALQKLKIFSSFSYFNWICCHMFHYPA